MVTAIILISVERHLLNETIDEIAKIKGITEVHSVVGEYDIAAIARVKSNPELSAIIADKMCRQMKAITRTKTLISLTSHFNYDAEKAYGEL